MTSDQASKSEVSDELALEARVARLEAQVYAQGERIAEFDEAARARKRWALWIRIVILALALTAFFALRAWGPGSAP